MLASGGFDGKVKIFDKRQSKIVQTFDDIRKSNIFLFNNKSFLITNCSYTDSIDCVRWSPNGDMLASASGDTTVALLDFRTGKKPGKTSDWSKFALSELYRLLLFTS